MRLHADHRHIRAGKLVRPSSILVRFAFGDQNSLLDTGGRCSERLLQSSLTILNER